MQKKLFNQFTAFGITDVGCVREQNEDNILIDEKLGLLIVADGMGGHHAGEIASIEAIRVIQKIIQMHHRSQENQSLLSHLLQKIRPKPPEIKEKQAILLLALDEANNHVYHLNLEMDHSSGRGMGTTIAGCWLISKNTLLVFHIGDSRIYRFKKQKLEGLSKDHSVLQEWHDNGCKGEKPKANVINKAVGPYSRVIPAIQTVKINKTDGFLLCSDGLTDMISDLDIKKALQGIKSKKIESYSEKLVKLAKKQGGKDNISVILMTQN